MHDIQEELESVRVTAPKKKLPLFRNDFENYLGLWVIRGYLLDLMKQHGTHHLTGQKDISVSQFSKMCPEYSIMLTIN